LSKLLLAQKWVKEVSKAWTYGRPMIPGPAQPKTVAVCLCCVTEAPATGEIMETSRGYTSQLVPIQVLTVFRVFVFQTHFLEADLGSHYRSALYGKAFLSEWGGYTETTYIFLLRFHLHQEDVLPSVLLTLGS
jgi:hypothetical protein